ncbi:MAG: glycosyltransferase family 2 protein [Patescibacteria group bacterium]|nr:glycosyltransferase family 2 protein [Patescibacteria group bacterium]
MQKFDLSVCILALNEEKNLSICLESIKSWAGEIIIGIDDQTTDKSLEIAKTFTNKVFKLKHVELFHKNKQKVVDKATKSWVLWLDADEKVDDDLVKEIKRVVKEKVAFGYLIPRKNYIFNKWIQNTGWYPDYQLRLWQKGKVKWPCKSIHENPIINGKTEKLFGHLIHLNYFSVSQFLKKLDKYTSLDAKRLNNEIKAPYYKHILVRPLNEFIKRLVALKGYKDGLHGLILSLLQSFYELVVVIKIWEINKFKPENPEVMKKVEKEGKKIQKVFKWWKRELKIKETESQVIKIWNKSLRKLGF